MFAVAVKDNSQNSDNIFLYMSRGKNWKVDIVCLYY